MALADVHARLDAEFPAALERIREFLRQPSVSAENFGMRETADWLVRRLEALGAKVELIEGARHPVVYAEIRRGRPKTLVLYGMYDTQPVGNLDEWRSGPFEAALEEHPTLGQVVVGRGALNSKGPLGALVEALAAIAAADDFPVDLILTLEGEEEIGSPTLPVLYRERRATLMRATAGVDFYFTQEANGEVEVGLGAKGMCHVTLTSRGGHWCTPSQDVHSSASPVLASPAWRLVQALACLKDAEERILVTGFNDAVVPPSAADMELLRAYARRMSREDFMARYGANAFLGDEVDLSVEGLVQRLLFQPTLNLAAMTAGEPDAKGDKTIIPGEAVAYLDVRLVPEMEVDDTVAKLRRHLDAEGFADVELTVSEAYSWSKVDPAAPVVRTMVESYRAHGVEPLLIPSMPWSSPYYLFDRLLGLPYVIFGLGHGGGAHAPNEYCTVAGLKDFMKSVATFLYRFAEQGDLGEPDYMI